jgi:hypothetical protein
MCYIKYNSPFKAVMSNVELLYNDYTTTTVNVQHLYIYYKQP